MWLPESLEMLGISVSTMSMILDGSQTSFQLWTEFEWVFNISWALPPPPQISSSNSSHARNLSHRQTQDEEKHYERKPSFQVTLLGKNEQLWTVAIAYLVKHKMLRNITNTRLKLRFLNIMFCSSYLTQKVATFVIIGFNDFDEQSAKVQLLNFRLRWEWFTLHRYTIIVHFASFHRSSHFIVTPLFTLHRFIVVHTASFHCSSHYIVSL